jgi:putative protease
MKNTNKKIELLSPAKTAEIGIAAIKCGADAVYIAAEKFSARENAGNALDDIEKLIHFAHAYYARVYIALNTILKNSELKEALKRIKNLHTIGADALIIQDFGLLELDLPPIPLIASTQMNSDSVDKVLFLEKVGFKRVILPRELNIAQIKEIRSKTSIELEAFVHGSLCVAYSGECYLSYAIGGRSANRGACAQPCRDIYTLINEDGDILAKNKHLLSLKDLNRSDDLALLIEAGITSFKIEGRLKDKAYVANITSFYRKKIDALIEAKKALKSSSGHVTFDFTPDPHKTFNRSYTAYALHGNKEIMASIYTPKSVGEKIGSVKKVTSAYFVLENEHTLKNGDGICFLDSDAILRGTQINKVDGNKIYPDKLHYIGPQTIIFRNLDLQFAKMLEKVPAQRKISLALTLEESADGFALHALDEDLNTGTFSLEAPKNSAEKRELADETIHNQLSSLNDTIFKCTKLINNCTKIYFLPRSVLNQLRRGVIKNLLHNRSINRPVETGKIKINAVPYPLSTITYLGNVLNSKAKIFYERHGAHVNESAAENGLDMSKKRLMVCTYCIKKELELCGKKSGELYLINSNGHKLRLQFNCSLCQMEVYNT